MTGWQDVASAQHCSVLLLVNKKYVESVAYDVDDWQWFSTLKAERKQNAPPGSLSCRDTGISWQGHMTLYKSTLLRLACALHVHCMCIACALHEAQPKCARVPLHLTVLAPHLCAYAAAPADYQG